MHIKIIVDNYPKACNFQSFYLKCFLLIDSFHLIKQNFKYFLTKLDILI